MKTFARGFVCLLLAGYTLLLYRLSSTDNGAALVVPGGSAYYDSPACFESTAQHRGRRSGLQRVCPISWQPTAGWGIGTEFQVILLSVDVSSTLPLADSIPGGDMLFVAASIDSMTLERCPLMASLVRHLVAAQRWRTVRAQIPLVCQSATGMSPETVADSVRKRRIFREWSTHRIEEADVVQSLTVSTLRDARFALESPLASLGGNVVVDGVGDARVPFTTAARSIDILLLPIAPAAAALHRAMSNNSKSADDMVTPLAVEDSLHGTEQFLATWTAKFSAPLTLLVYASHAARVDGDADATQWTVTPVDWSHGGVDDRATQPKSGGRVSRFTTVVTIPRSGRTSHLVLSVHPSSGDAWPSHQLQVAIP